ncbi:MAG: hypothetical protein O3C40_22845 [Planctomycetota bacterium]|nr:hypothetical protein [Planctomycetota bacterium]
MTIANCPRCCEQVSVPENASPEATVRCPLCQDEYPLAEALAQLPPSLIVVSDFGETPATAGADEEDSPWAAFNVDDHDGDEVALAPMDDAGPAAPFDIARGTATTSGKPTAAIRSISRSTKPKGNPIKSVLSIVIGGLMAFPIAQLILWYLPGDLKRDFGAGPIVARHVPAIVPAKFRGGTANAESNSEPAFQDSDVPGSGFNFGDTSKFDGAGASGGNAASPNKKKADNRKKQQVANDAAASLDEPAADEQMSVDDAAAAGADLFGGSLEVPGLELGGLPLIDAPVSPKELSNDDVPPRTIDPPEPEVSSLAPGNIRNAPQVSADDVIKSFQSALSGNLAWDTDEASSPSGALKREFYSAFSKLGEALTFADRADERVAMQIAETATLLQEVGRQADKLAVIGGVANGWIAAGYETRKTNGICLHGVVKSVEPIGNFFETTVESGNQQISVVSMTDPSEYFAEGRQVLVLGTILDDPAKNLGGYEGSREVVVLDGFHVNVAAE